MYINENEKVYLFVIGITVLLFGLYIYSDFTYTPPRNLEELEARSAVIPDQDQWEESQCGGRCY